MFKRTRVCSSIMILLICFLSSTALAAEPKISAKSAILIDANSGQVIVNKNAHELRQPASTTKIMTAILAIECGELDEIIEVSSHAAKIGEASVHLTTGDRLQLISLLHGALIKSGNDACVAVSESIAPSEEEFIGLMNLKAITLGAYDTHFSNTNGLPNNKHLTTAYDLAMIARYAMDNPIFSEIVRKKYYTMRWEEPKRALKIKNTNKLLWSYEKATGIKTGTTKKAGQCLVASASNKDKEVIVVVLNSSDRFNDAKKLLQYGLEEGENYAKR